MRNSHQEYLWEGELEVKDGTEKGDFYFSFLIFSLIFKILPHVYITLKIFIIRISLSTYHWQFIIERYFHTKKKAGRDCSLIIKGCPSN